MKMYHLDEFPNFPFKNWEDIQDIACLKLEEHYGQDIPIPTPIEEIIEIKEGITVEFDQLKSNILGESYVDHKIMWIDSTLEENNMIGRRRFTMAHEYGHFILHSPYFKGVPALHASDFYLNNARAIERQADYFGGCILMPSPLLLQKWEEFTGIKMNVLDARLEKEHNIALEHKIEAEHHKTKRPFSLIYYEYYQNYSPKNYRLIYDLASIFEVSFEACRVMIRKTGIPLWAE